MEYENEDQGNVLMENEKIENLLNLALQATPTELDRSLELEEGFDRRERTWEVVVKYTGSVEVLREMLQNRFSSYFAQIQIIKQFPAGNGRRGSRKAPAPPAAGRRLSDCTDLFGYRLRAP